MTVSRPLHSPRPSPATPGLGEDPPQDHDPADQTGATEAAEEMLEEDLALAAPPLEEVETLEIEGEIPLPKALQPLKVTYDTQDPLTAYLRAVHQHPLLTPEETHDLAVRFVKTGDPSLAARLVTANLRLVIKIAHEYRRAYKNLLDLIQEGNIGLMQAVKRYDPYRGVKLSSYGAWWIRAYILRFLLNNWRLVKLGTTQAQRKLFFNLHKTRAALVARGIDPSHAEIAKELQVTESEVVGMDLRLGSSEKSLDEPVGSDEKGMTRVEWIPHLSAGPEEETSHEESLELLREHLLEFRNSLLDKEKELAIFEERLVAEEPLTLQEIGTRFGISRERVRQLEQRVSSRLRDFFLEKQIDFSHFF